MGIEDIESVEADPAAAAAPRKRGSRVLRPLLVLALLLLALGSAAAAYYLVSLSGASTAQVASAGTYKIELTGQPSAPVQGEAFEYSFDVETAGAETGFAYVLAIGPGVGSEVPADGVRCRLWRKDGDAETEIAVSSDGLFRDAAMSFGPAAGTQRHGYVLRAISNEPGRLELDVTVEATQARAS